MPTGIQNWSTTPATNATADSSINMAEGMAPSAVNDGIRALMARVKELYNDLGGITTGGSSTAYTITSNRNFTTAALMDKAIICIVPHTTSGATPTLAVDGLTARQIRSATGVNVPTGALVSGTPYMLIYINASTEFILIGPLGVLPPLTGPCPIGSLMDFAGSSAPTGWLLCYGQAVSRTTYASLFATVSTTYGIGDGSTTFNLPDCRGRVVAGKDDMGGSAASRVTTAGSSIDGTALGAAGGAQTVTIAQANLPNVNFTVSGITLNDPGHFHTFPTNDTIARGGSDKCADTTIQTGSNNTSTATTGITISSQGSAASGGSGTAVNKMPPAIIFNKIIFAGV